MADEEIVTDWYGVPIGRLKKNGDSTEVTDWHGQPIGTADEKGTRDFFGVPISPQNVPGLLLSEHYNPTLKAQAELDQKDAEHKAWVDQLRVEADLSARRLVEERDREFAEREEKERKIREECAPKPLDGKNASQQFTDFCAEDKRKREENNRKYGNSWV